LIVLLVVLLVFGAKRLPEIGASMGKGIREFKKSINEIGHSVDTEDRHVSDDRPSSLQEHREVRVPDAKGPKRLSQ
jgi:sec-independent protein translocase protein TatA